jgi:hypothetical protein
MGRLFAEQGIDFSTLSIGSVKAEQWDNESLGCPAPGFFYNTVDAPYLGFSYIITNGSTDWEYHSDESDSIIIRCSEIESKPANQSAVNITQQAKLDDATKVTLMRRDFEIDEFVVRREMMEDDMRLLISIFDLDTDLAPETPCNTIFRLDFETPSGVTEIEFICEENYKAFDVFWNNLQGNALIVGKIIGPYLTGDPIPSLPTAAP